MNHTFLKFKAASNAALQLKFPPLCRTGLVVPLALSLALATAGTASARTGPVTAALTQGLAAVTRRPLYATCYPVPTQGGGPLEGTPPLSINPVDWIGWVLGELCKAVATVFFTLTNQVINWGSGCSQAGLNFVTQTPDYIRLDASKADNWQLFFWDGRFIGAALLLQFSWTALTIIWNRQSGNGFAGAQEAVTRTLLGGILLIISASLLDWSVNLCNLLNGLFADRLTLFDPNAFQVDASGNIFNTVLAMAAALASLLLVMQMATRYIYLILLQFIFPLGSIFWVNRGSQGYARLLFSSFIATLFVQPLQLAVIYITGNLKDGTRDDTSLSMLFGICGLFLALGLPRVMGSVLGGGTPVGAWGIFAISRMAIGGVSSAVRSATTGSGSGGGGNGPGFSRGSGGSGGPGNFPRRSPLPPSGGGSGGGGNSGPAPGNGFRSSGSGGNSPRPWSTGPGGSGTPSSAATTTKAPSGPSSNPAPAGSAGTGATRGTGAGNPATATSNGSEEQQSLAPAFQENLRHGGLGQAALRRTSPTLGNPAPGQAQQNFARQTAPEPGADLLPTVSAASAGAAAATTATPTPARTGSAVKPAGSAAKSVSGSGPGVSTPVTLPAAPTSQSGKPLGNGPASVQPTATPFTGQPGVTTLSPPVTAVGSGAAQATSSQTARNKTGPSFPRLYGAGASSGSDLAGATAGETGQGGATAIYRNRHGLLDHPNSGASAVVPASPSHLPGDVPSPLAGQSGTSSQAGRLATEPGPGDSASTNPAYTTRRLRPGRFRNHPPGPGNNP